MVTAIAEMFPRHFLAPVTGKKISFNTGAGIDNQVGSVSCWWNSQHLKFCIREMPHFSFSFFFLFGEWSRLFPCFTTLNFSVPWLAPEPGTFCDPWGQDRTPQEQDKEQRTCCCERCWKRARGKQGISCKVRAWKNITLPVGIDGFGEQRLLRFLAALRSNPLVGVVRGSDVSHGVAASRGVLGTQQRCYLL